MFDLGWSELLIIAVVMIVVVGPRELPKLLRTFGNTMGRMRRMAGEFQDQFREAMREAELEETRREMEKLRESNPLTDIRDEVKSVADQAKFDPDEIAARKPDSDETDTDFAPAAADEAPGKPAASDPAPAALAPVAAAPEEPRPTPAPAASPAPVSDSVSPVDAAHEPERSSVARSA